MAATPQVFQEAWMNVEKIEQPDAVHKDVPCIQSNVSGEKQVKIRCAPPKKRILLS